MQHPRIIETLTTYFGEMGKEVVDDTHLFEDGIIDSLGMLDLVEFIEDEFGITLKQSLLVIENFETLGRVASTVLIAAKDGAGSE